MKKCQILMELLEVLEVFELCKSLEPGLIHGELNGMCFGCVCGLDAK